MVYDRLSDEAQSVRLEKYVLAGSQPKPEWAAALTKKLGSKVEQYLPWVSGVSVLV
jgi:hypothetical protein